MGVVIPQVVSEDRASGAQIVDGGLRFDSGKSQGLTITPGSAGNRSTWTWSGWTKRNIMSVRQYIFSATSGGSNSDAIYFHEDNTLRVHWDDGLDGVLVTTQLFRDPSAWYHLLWSVDFTQSTSTNRVKLYVNGTQITSFSTSTYPSQNYANGDINNTVAHAVGRRQISSPDYYLSAQLSNVYLIDGQALDPSYFGYTDPLTNTWRPKKLSSSVAFGTNGFYLPFDGSAPIGQDQSGRGNDWTPVNFGGSNTLEKATGALPILNTDGGGKVARVGVRTDSSASSLVLALPLVGIKSDFSNAVNSGTTEKAITNTSVTFSSSVGNFYGGSASFNGSAYLDVSGTLFSSSSWTFEAWLYMNSGSGMDLLSIGGNSCSWWITSSSISCDGNGVGRPNYTSLGTGIKIPISTWFHFVQVNNNGTYSVYINGIKYNASSTGGGIPSGALSLGNTRTDNSVKWNGYIQDARLYEGLVKYTSNFIPASTDPDILPDTPSGVSYTSNLTQITDGAVAFDGSGDYLTVSKTNTWPTGTQDATIEFFLYRNGSGSSVTLFGKDYSGAGLSCFYLTSSNVLYFYDNNIATTGGNGIGGVSIAQSKWYHIALTRSGSSLRLFLDGQLIDSNLSASGNWYDSGSISYVMIGARENPIGNQSHNGFISNSHVVFDTALYTSNFTPPTAGISSVANTKLLCCKSNSSATAFDVSPGTITANGNAAATNFNPFTVNINTQRGKQSGYCTWNPLDFNSSGTLSNGNLQWANTSDAHYSVRSSFSMKTGKWYAEGTVLVNTNSVGSAFGIALRTASLSSYTGDTGSWSYHCNGNKYLNGASGVSFGIAYGTTVGNVVGLAFDADNGNLDGYLNGVYQGRVVSGLSSNDYFWMVNSYNWTWATNFGQKPFKFPPPAGFQPLALANTPRPTIVRPDQYVGVTTYSGNGTNGRQINVGWKPDLVWIKGRENMSDGFPYDHNLYDTVRGAGKNLRSSNSAAENTNDQYGYISSFTNTGFTVTGGSTDDYYVNDNGKNFVAWCWKAGGNSNTFNINDVGYATASAAGLTAGTITPTGASVNTKSGFSIITYTGTGSGSATIDHGLGKNPKLIFVKKRNSTSPWYTQHSALGAGQIAYLNATDAFGSSGGWNSTEPTNQVFSVASSLNDANTFVAYLWAEIPGFSKFGSYTGNGSADGPVINLNFRPRWLLIKSSSYIDEWRIYDAVRLGYNTVATILTPNDTQAEGTSSYTIDLLSNGFKLRGAGGPINTSSATYVFAAFAESPTFNLYGAQANAR